MNAFQKITSLLLFITACFFHLPAWSQNPNLDYKFGLRLYNNTSQTTTIGAQKNLPWDSTYYSDRFTRFISPGIGFQWKGKQDNFHEIQLSGFNWENTQKDGVFRQGPIPYGGDFTRKFTAAIGYEYNLLFLKKKNWKIIPTLGLFGTVYADITKKIPSSPTQFPSSYMSFGILTGATPGVQFHVLKKVFLSAQIPLTTYNSNFSRSRLQNPSLPNNQQSTTSYNLDSPMFRDWAVRVGIGIKL